VNHGITRRDLLALSAGSLALTRCSLMSGRQPQPRVSIVRAGYTQSIYDTVRRLLVEHRVDVRGKRVVIKPNLVEFDRGTTINTHPMLVHAALEGFRAMGAADVRIAEGPGHRRVTMDLADAAGYFETIPHFEDLFIDLNLDDVSQVLLRDPFSRLNSMYFPNTALAADLLVSLPKMKTHHWVGATLSMKNFFGLSRAAYTGGPRMCSTGPALTSALPIFTPRSRAILRSWTALSAWKATAPSKANPSRLACWWPARTWPPWMPPAAAS